MAEVEGMAVSELIPGRCKYEDVAGASPNAEAQRRARDIYLDDAEAIHSLKITGSKRLWGLLYEHEFSVIWWDPNHDIWPTKRVYDNTN